MSARKLTAALAALLACTAAPAIAQTVAITGGKVVVGDGSDPVEGATVLVRDGKVVAVGRDVAIPAGVRTVDARGKWVTPGLVVAGPANTRIPQNGAQAMASMSGTSAATASIRPRGRRTCRYRAKPTAPTISATISKRSPPRRMSYTVSRSVADCRMTSSASNAVENP